MSKKLDILLLILFPLLAVILSLIFQTNYLISTFLFFGPPAIYLSCRTKRAILRSLIFVSLISVLGLIFDHLAYLNQMWHTTSIFSFRLFGTIPFEDFVWGPLLFYFVVIFYEHFFDKGRHKVVASRIKYFAYLVITLFTIFLFFVFINPKFLEIDYFYLKGGIAFILIPAVAFLVKFPKFIKIFLKTAPYFFFVGLLQEITALQLGQWYFPEKSFVGWVSLLGYRFPFEELFFWLMLTAISVLSYFEFFDDDRLLSRK